MLNQFLFKVFRLRLASHDHAAVVFVDGSGGEGDIDLLAKILLMEDHGGLADVAVFPNAFAVDELGGLVPEGCATSLPIIEAVAYDAVFGRWKCRSDRALRRACDGGEDRRQLLEAKICLRFQRGMLSCNVVSQCGALYDEKFHDLMLNA